MWQLGDAELLAAWQPLPRVTQLQDRHLFPREDRVVFYEHDHSYLVDGVRVPRSVTSLLHAYATPFEPTRALACMKRRDWDVKREAMEQQGLGTSDEDIMARWRRNGEVQSKRGTLLHYHAECLLNGVEVDEPQSPEFVQVRTLYRALLLRGMTPHSTELCVFHCGLRVAGQIDALFLDADCKLVIVDWKRVRNLRTEGFDPSRYPLDRLPDSNYWIYSLQLNLYRYILETEYAHDVAAMYLAVVHPKQPLPRLVEVPRLEAEMRALHDFELEQGRAVSSAPSLDSPFEYPRNVRRARSIVFGSQQLAFEQCLPRSRARWFPRPWRRSLIRPRCQRPRA